MWEVVGDRTEQQHIDPHPYGHQRFFPILLGCSTGGLAPSLSECWFSLPHIISNWSDLQTDWISCALSYMIVQRPPSSCGRHNFPLIQPVHGRGYNSDIPRPDAPTIFTSAFPILTAWPGGSSIYNSYPPVSSSLMWRVDCFLVSSRTEDNQGYPYVGSWSKLMVRNGEHGLY